MRRVFHGKFGSAAHAIATSRKLAHTLRAAMDFIFLANIELSHAGRRPAVAATIGSAPSMSFVIEFGKRPKSVTTRSYTIDQGWFEFPRFRSFHRFLCKQRVRGSDHSNLTDISRNFDIELDYHLTHKMYVGKLARIGCFGLRNRNRRAVLCRRHSPGWNTLAGAQYKHDENQRARGDYRITHISMPNYVYATGRGSIKLVTRWK